MSLINRLKKGITICEKKWHNYYLSTSVLSLHETRTQPGERRKKSINFSVFCAPIKQQSDRLAKGQEGIETPSVIRRKNAEVSVN